MMETMEQRNKRPKRVSYGIITFSSTCTVGADKSPSAVDELHVRGHVGATAFAAHRSQLPEVNQWRRVLWRVNYH